MVSDKSCKDCGELRPAGEFTSDRARKDGLSFYCKTHARRRLLAAKDRRQGAPKSRHPREVQVPEGSEWCPDCSPVKPLTDFGRYSASPSGWSAYCKPCHNARGKASKDKLGGSRTYHLERRHGISADEADVLLTAQDRVCAICRTNPAVHVHHDHATGAVRALLCFNCNGGLGQFKDDPSVLRRAAEYVEFHTLSQLVLAAAAAAGLGTVRAVRPGEPPVGSQRRPGSRGTSSRTTGRSSGTRRRQSVGEADA